MLEKLYPDVYLDSAYGIDFEEMYRKGIRGILFDIDNTLVPHGAPPDDRARELFSRLRQIGFSCCVLSNNKEPRVKPFCDEVHIPYICHAHKPSVGNYKEAMRMLGTDAGSTVFIGDQIFTDIYGANRAGIPTILVKPIHPKEEIQIVLKRYLERIVLFFYKKKLKKEK